MSLSQDQIARIVSGAEVAPHGWRCLTSERALAYLRNEAARATSTIGEYEVAEIDRPVFDKRGAVVLDSDGLPKIERVRVSKRSVVAKPFLVQLKKQQDLYARKLRLSNEQHAEVAEDVQRAIAREFGEPSARSGLHREVQAFARSFRATREQELAGK